MNVRWNYGQEDLDFCERIFAYVRAVMHESFASEWKIRAPPALSCDLNLKAAFSSQKSLCSIRHIEFSDTCMEH